MDRADPTAAAVDWPAAEIMDTNWDNAELAFVLAVLDVDAVPAAAVFTSVVVCPVVLPPVAPCQNESHPVCRLVAVVLRNEPTAAAVDCPAAVIIAVNCDKADDALELAVFAVDCAVPAFVIAVLALVDAVAAVDAVEDAAVFTSVAVWPVVPPPVSPCHS